MIAETLENTEIISEDRLEQALYTVCLAIQDPSAGIETKKELGRQRKILLSAVKPYCIMEMPDGFPTNRLDLDLFDDAACNEALSAIYRGLVCDSTKEFLKVEDQSEGQARINYYRGYFVGSGFFRVPILRPKGDAYMKTLPHFFEGWRFPSCAELADGSCAPYLLPIMPEADVDNLVSHIQEGTYLYYPKLLPKSVQKKRRAVCLRMSEDRAGYYAERRAMQADRQVKARQNFIIRCMQKEACGTVLFPVDEPKGIDDDILECFNTDILPYWEQIKRQRKPDPALVRHIQKAIVHLQSITCEPYPYADSVKRKKILIDSILRFTGTAVTVRTLVQTYPDVSYYIGVAEARNRKKAVEQLLSILPCKLRDV